jgi:hypothetical protein
MANEPAQLSVGNVNCHILRKENGEFCKVVAQTVEFAIGKISTNSANCSFRKSVQELYTERLVQSHRRKEGYILSGRR